MACKSYVGRLYYPAPKREYHGEAEKIWVDSPFHHAHDQGLCEMLDNA